MFGIRFIKVQPTTYLLQYRRGKIVREGVGLSFFYYGPTTSLVAVPVASIDTPFIFQETTGDFQTVTIQGQVTHRVSEPKRLAGLLNYTLARDGETYVLKTPRSSPSVSFMSLTCSRGPSSRSCRYAKPCVLRTNSSKR